MTTTPIIRTRMFIVETGCGPSLRATAAGWGRTALVLGLALGLAAEEPVADYPPPLPRPQAAEGHWVAALLAAGHAQALEQPEVVRAEREIQRSELVRFQVIARWNPELTLGTNFDENRRLSTSSVDGFGLVVDQSATVNTALSNTFSTGTTVRLQAVTQRTNTTSASALNDEFYNSTVQLVLSQALLQGGRHEANTTDLHNAIDQAESDRDTRDELIESRLLALCESWLDLAQREIELEVRREHLVLLRRYLGFAEERARLGLGRELDAFSLRRDVAADEAAIGSGERAITAIRERLQVEWPAVDRLVPDGAAEHDRAAPPPAVGFAETRGGRTALRRVAAGARTLAVARANSLDRLDLTGSVGKNGTDPSLGGSWSEVGDPETYRWALGLTYTHRFGSDQERIELHRAGLALDQATLQGRVDERTWRTQAITLRLALSDARARVGELERVYEAYRQEFRLTKAQADAGLIAMRDLISVDNQLNTALTQVIQAHLDTLRAEVRLRAHEDRLLELLPQ